MTTSTAVALPDKKKRLAVYNSMPKALQEVADEMETREQRQNQGNALIAYDNGLMIRTVIEKEGEFGSGAVEKLALYRGKTATELYKLRDFASTFERNFVADWSARPTGKGNFLTESHWLAITKVQKASDREMLLKKVINESLTANQLELEISSGNVRTKNVRSGGRKPSRPTSPLAGLQKFGSMSLALYNYGEVAEKDVFEAIDEISPDTVNDILLERLKVTKDNTEKAVKRLEEAVEHLDGNIERVENILADKADKAEAEGAADADDEDEENEEPKVKTKTKPSANGAKAKKGKGKKKSKVSKPAAATIG